MKNRISLFLLSLIAVFTFIACEDDTTTFDGPYTIDIGGASSVHPGDVEEYTIGDYENTDSYTWSVEGPAQIVGNASGSTVSVEFQEVGTVTITVNGGENENPGAFTVEVEDVVPALSTELNGTGVLRNAEKDTVFFSFEAPLAKDPKLTFLTASDSSGINEGELAFASGVLGSLIKVDAQNYYAIYTAGEGNGTPEALLRDIIATSSFGSDTVDSAYVALYRVDNIAPTADLSYSEELVNDSTVVTITATFSEPVMFADPSDSTLFISFSGAGVAEERDSLMATEDPLVYTYEYTVNGEGEGTIDVDLESIVDLAGNPLETSSITNRSILEVDNTAPVGTGAAIDAGNFVTISMSATEMGTGMYLVLEEDEEAPTTAEEFMDAEGIASGSINLPRAGALRSVDFDIAEGSYDVYFMTQDTAGNYSGITTAPLVVED